MKKLVAIFLLITFLFNLGGSWLVFTLVHKKIRAEVRNYMQSLPESELLSFDLAQLQKLPANRFKFVKENEFKLDNVLYDIVKVDNFDANTVLVFADKREMDFLSAILGEKITDIKEFCLSLFHLLIKEATISAIYYFKRPIFPLFEAIYSPQNFGEIQTTLMFAFICVPTPPPNVN